MLKIATPINFDIYFQKIIVEDKDIASGNDYVDYLSLKLYQEGQDCFAEVSSLHTLCGFSGKFNKHRYTGISRESANNLRLQGDSYIFEDLDSSTECFITLPYLQDFAYIRNINFNLDVSYNTPLEVGAILKYRASALSSNANRGGRSIYSYMFKDEVNLSGVDMDVEQINIVVKVPYLIQ